MSWDLELLHLDTWPDSQRKLGGLVRRPGTALVCRYRLETAGPTGFEIVTSRKELAVLVQFCWSSLFEWSVWHLYVP